MSYSKLATDLDEFFFVDCVGGGGSEDGEGDSYQCDGFGRGNGVDNWSHPITWGDQQGSGTGDGFLEFILSAKELYLFL
jgi:hypothetical protein